MQNGPADYLKLGDYNAICDRCGGKFKMSELSKEWTGYMVCKVCLEPRHPQDLIKARVEKISPPWTRPAQKVYVTGLGYQLADGYWYADGSAVADGGWPSDQNATFVVFGPVDPDSL